jgi:hypothetical protein
MAQSTGKVAFDPSRTSVGFQRAEKSGGHSPNGVLNGRNVALAGPLAYFFPLLRLA